MNRRQGRSQSSHVLQGVARYTLEVEVATLWFCYDDATTSREALESHYQLETKSWQLSGSWFGATAEFKASYP